MQLRSLDVERPPAPLQSSKGRERSSKALATISDFVVDTRLTEFHVIQADWAHLSSDVLAAIVLKQDLQAQKAMHNVCQQWTTAVRCNMQSMQPLTLHTEHLKMYFPAVRQLFLKGIPFEQNSTLCLATMKQLQGLRIQHCSFVAGESIAELATLSGRPAGTPFVLSAPFIPTEHHLAYFISAIPERQESEAELAAKAGTAAVTLSRFVLIAPLQLPLPYSLKCPTLHLPVRR